MLEKIDISTLNDNFFTRIGREWMLVTAGNATKCNTMTASWGGIGVLWNKNVAFSFIRDSRYTLEFMDNSDYYTLSFFGGNMMKELTFCGKNSGREVDKIKETGLIPVHDGNITYFEQAELVFVCKKLFKQPVSPDGFVDKTMTDKFYADNDLHELYVGEIAEVLKKA